MPASVVWDSKLELGHDRGVDFRLISQYYLR